LAVGGEPAAPARVAPSGRANLWTVPTLLPDRRIDYLLTGWPRRGGVGSAVASGGPISTTAESNPGLSV
jgi:hypothetical protein